MNFICYLLGLATIPIIIGALFLIDSVIESVEEFKTTEGQKVTGLPKEFDDE